MLTIDRFVRTPPERQAIFQPDCPIYVHCLCRNTERRSGSVLAQVRMVNRSKWTVLGVWLTLRGSDASGKPLFSTPALLTGLHAAPFSVFGEQQLLPVGGDAPRLSVTVERVAFDGGVSWKRLPEQPLVTVEEAGWTRCLCGMPNPPDAVRCTLCRRRVADFDITRPIDDILPLVASEDFADPVLPPEVTEEDPPEAAEADPPDEEFDDEEEEDAPLWLRVLFWLISFAALAVIAAIAAFCIWRRFLQ